MALPARIYVLVSFIVLLTAAQQQSSLVIHPPMHHYLLTLYLIIFPLFATALPNSGTVTSTFVPESAMQDSLLQMLARFMVYTRSAYQPLDSTYGVFRGENTMGSNEQGVRHNADLSMICAFMAKYAQGHVTLPKGVTWSDIETMAMRSLVYAYSTHKAVRLRPCKNGKYWGSVSVQDHTWGSPLWALSVAYSAFFQWDKLSQTQRGYIERLLKAECHYELYRNIPTAYQGNTKAEENGWEAGVIAVTLGLFPDDALAPKWFDRLRAFAINSYSHPADAIDTTIIDPCYDKKTVADYHVGPNLYDDYTLQNHNFFHTSYQNVVIQELGEAALALKLFQQELHGQERWHTHALMHNNDRVMNDVLKWLALADGELAMPNGNDWSLFLYDQITSYTTNACFLRDNDALMLENLAYKMIKARQATTKDGAWLLRPDVGARRMGVQAHRVMMTWLMHHVLSTAKLAPTAWTHFNLRYEQAKIFKSQNIVRAATRDRFTCFSWSARKRSYTGYIASNNLNNNNIIVPYRIANTGNLIGYYEVTGQPTDATPVVSGIYNLRGNSYTMNGEINTNGATLNNRFVLYSSPGNAVVWLDYVRANASCTIRRERGALMAISTDELTRKRRTLYYADTLQQHDGSLMATFNSKYVNIDNAVGIITDRKRAMAFGDKKDNHSVLTSKLYTCYNDRPRKVRAGQVVDRRCVVYYSNINAERTKDMSRQLRLLSNAVPQGWNGAIVSDPDSTRYLLLANFASRKHCTLLHIGSALGAPIFSVPTLVCGDRATATFSITPNHAVANTLRFFLTTRKGHRIRAMQAPRDSGTIYITAPKYSVRNLFGRKKNVVGIIALANGKRLEHQVTITPGQTVIATIRQRQIVVEQGRDIALTVGR